MSGGDPEEIQVNVKEDPIITFTVDNDAGIVVITGAATV